MPMREEGLEQGTFTPLISHFNGQYGKGVLAIPEQTGAADLHQERRRLCQNNLLDKSKDIPRFIKIRTNLPYIHIEIQKGAIV